MLVRQQPVTLAGAEGNLVAVAQGLKPGDVVVTAGVHTLSAGQKVRWYNEPAAAAGGTGLRGHTAGFALKHPRQTCAQP